jgi:hypothetical protein
MFWPFRSANRWQRVKNREGFSAEMPARPTHSRRRDGELQLNTYQARTTGLTCQITIRSGPSVEAAADAELLDGWKAEFVQAMASAGVPMELVSDSPVSGGRDLCYQRTGGTVLARIRLVRDATVLFALSAIGGPEQVRSDGERFLKSFCLA